jgi:hypothetical protein
MIRLKGFKYIGSIGIAGSVFLAVEFTNIGNKTIETLPLAVSHSSSISNSDEPSRSINTTDNYTSTTTTSNYITTTTSTTTMLERDSS